MAQKTQQEIMQDLALDRDGKAKALEEKTAELAAFQKAHTALQEDHTAFEQWAKDEIAKAKCPPPESGFSLNLSFTGKTITQGQVTFRTPTVEAWRSAFDQFAAMVKERGWEFAKPPEPAQLGANPPALTNGAQPATAAPFYWKMKGGALDIFKGKLTLVLRGETGEPNEVPCPQHPGKTLKRRTNDNGAWLSHKVGDDNFCSARFERE